MKFTRTLQGTAAALLCLASATAFAQAAANPAATPGIDKRQEMQEKRIDQGQASGQLTPRESRKLDHQQARINRAESTAKADGTVTRAERKRLHKLQNHASHSIKRQKHDRQHRAGAMPPSGPGTGVNRAPGG